VTSDKEAAGSKGEKGAELYGRRQPAACDAKGRERENLWSMRMNDCERNRVQESTGWRG